MALGIVVSLVVVLVTVATVRYVRTSSSIVVNPDLVVFSSGWGDYHTGEGWSLTAGGEPVWFDEWGPVPCSPEEIEWVNRTHSSVTPAMRRLIKLGVTRRRVLHLTNNLSLPREKRVAANETTQAAMVAAWGEVVALFREERERRQQATLAAGIAAVEAMSSPSRPTVAELR